MTTKTEQERAEFEAWYRDTYNSTLYCEARFEGWQAGRAALQSQDREDAERYRFLRKQQPSSIHDSEQSIHAIKEAWARDFDPEARINVWSSAWLSGAELDAAIDHACRVEGEAK